MAFAGFYPRPDTDADSLAVCPGDRNARAINLLQSIKSFSEPRLPRWFSGLDSVLPKQRAPVWSLVGELRSHMPTGIAKSKKEMLKNLKYKLSISQDSEMQNVDNTGEPGNHGRTREALRLLTSGSNLSMQTFLPHTHSTTSRNWWTAAQKEAPPHTYKQMSSKMGKKSLLQTEPLEIKEHTVAPCSALSHPPS